MQDNNPRVPLRVRFVVVPEGASVPPSILLTGDMIRVGRLASNDLVMPRTALSVGREHAVFRPVDGTWRIVDQSSNGTYHNGQFLHHAVSEPLKHDDVLVLGEVELRVELVEEQHPGQRVTVSEPIFPQPGDSVLHPGGWQEGHGDGLPGGAGVAPTGERGLENHAVDVPQPVVERSMTSVLREIDEKLGGFHQRQQTNSEGQTQPVAEEQMQPHVEDRTEPVDEDWKRQVDDVQTEPADEERPQPAVSQTALLDAFLAGAGIRELPPDLDPAVAMRALGESSRVIVLTLADILQARRELKHVFRIRQTVVDRSRNNPLKFAADEQEMLLALLGKPRPGYVTGVDAVAEAGKDLMRHQIAVIEAYRAVIDAIFARLSPERIEGLGKGRNRLLGDGFKEHYSRAYADLREDFGEVVSGKLGKLFAETYEQHAPSVDPAAHGGWGRPPSGDP